MVISLRFAHESDSHGRSQIGLSAIPLVSCTHQLRSPHWYDMMAMMAGIQFMTAIWYCVIEKHSLVNSLAMNKPRMYYQDSTLISKNVSNSSLSKAKLLLNQHQCTDYIRVEACTVKGNGITASQKDSLNNNSRPYRMYKSK